MCSNGDVRADHAMGHLEFLMESGDPVTHQPIGNTRENLASTQVI
jgi:hypothetical protein